MSQFNFYIQKLRGMSRIEDGSVLVIDPYSAGDVFQTLTLMDHFKKFHNIRSLHFMCLRRTARVVCLFQNVDILLAVNSIDEEKLALLTQTKWYNQQSVIFVAPPELHIDNFKNAEAMHYDNYMQLKSAVLRLPQYSRPVLPKQNNRILHLAQKSAIDQNISPGSVIIFNHAYTIQPLNPDVFLPLKEIFGDKIFFDSWSGAPIDWGRKVEIPLEQIPFFCNLAGNVICIRSGITDILSLSDACIHTIYPSGNWMAPWIKNKNGASQMFRSWGIRDLDLNRNSKERKIFIENDDTDNVVAAKIFSSVINNKAF